MARIQCSFQDHSGLMEARSGRWDIDLEFGEWRHVVKGEQREETEDWIQAMMCKNKALVIDRTRIPNFFSLASGSGIALLTLYVFKSLLFCSSCIILMFHLFSKNSIKEFPCGMGVKFQHCLCNGDGSTTGRGISPSHRCSLPSKKKALKVLWLILITDILGIVFNFVPT